MKILWLFRYTPHRHYNHWFHTDFAKEIAKSKNVDLKLYGYNMHMKHEYKELLIRPWQQHILLSDLKKEYNYDIVILDGINRMYKTTFIKEKWITEKSFKSINIPIINLEGDYHNIFNKSIYYNFNINLIIHRHFSNVLRAKKDLPIKSIWLPCSIDTDIFKPNININRINKICLVGEARNKVYLWRKESFDHIDKKFKFKQRLVREEEYIKCLQQYISHLNGSSIFNLDMAKMFEIMACGSVLFTDKTDLNGLTKLFPSNTYCTYERNYSDISNKVKKIINDLEYRKITTSNAIKCIKNKHTHKIRVQQLLKIIKDNYGLS